MYKPMGALAVLSAMSVASAAQPMPQTNPAQPPKPQMIKKRVCEQIDEDPYSRLGNRKICKTIEVPAPANAMQPPADQPKDVSGN